MVTDSPQIKVVSCKTKQSTDAFTQLLNASGFPASVRLLTSVSELLRIRLSDEVVVLMAEGFSSDDLDVLRVFRAGYENKLVLVMEKLEEHFVRSVHTICDEFIISPVDQNELVIRLGRLKTSTTTTKLKKGFTSTSQRMIGKSAIFMNLLRKISMVSRVDIPVLIQGETGTGKELAARAIHYQGDRKGYPFIPVNCGTLPDELLENELFGHEQGAFTDAKRAHEGLVAQAEGGTLFLDEIETLSYKGQIALLRFMQEQEFRPLGSNRSYQSDIRVISASNADLKQMVADGEFREDLFFRLNVLPVEIPPLRERHGDIECLIDFYWNKFRNIYPGRQKALSESSRAWMLKYPWPGNIRELENLLHREYILSDAEVVSVSPPTEFEPQTGEEAFNFQLNIRDYDFNTAKSEVITNFEKSYLTRLMDMCQGNVSEAARCAGKERRSLGKLLKKYGINRSSYL